MKVSREQAAQNRERIVESAAQLFRERGLDGIGVADLMKAAGLTHGGFYGHFSSKDDLIAQACARAFARGREAWEQRAARAPADALSAIVGEYLSRRHHDDPGTGCALATLGPEVARQGPAVRRAVSEGVFGLVDFLAGLIPGRSEAAKRQKAISAYAGMIGGIIMARAVNDRALSQEILSAVAASVGASVACRRGPP